MKCGTFRVLFSILFFAQVTIAEMPDPGPLRIGGILILSGLGAQYGTHALQGATLALEDINRSGGIRGRKLEVLWEDETGGRAERAVAAYRKLVSSDKVSFIFGPTFQDGMMALAPLLRRDGVFLVTPATPRLGLPGVFSTWTDPDGETAEMAKLVHRRHSRVAVLSGQQSWEQLAAKKFIEAFEGLGGTICDHEEPLITTSSVRTEVLKARASKPEAFFISSFTLFSLYAREIRNQGMKVPLFTIEADSSLLENADGKGEGTISIGPSAPESEFSRSYRSRYKVDPDIPSWQAYDAMMLLAKALRATDGTPRSVEKYFDELAEYDGASGLIRSKGGVVSVSTAFFEAKAGKFLRVSQ